VAESPPGLLVETARDLAAARGQAASSRPSGDQERGVSRRWTVDRSFAAVAGRDYKSYQCLLTASR
jgi:hypothetical protein